MCRWCRMAYDSASGPSLQHVRTKQTETRRDREGEIKYMEITGLMQGVGGERRMQGLDEKMNDKIQGLIILGSELREPVVSYNPVFDPPNSILSLENSLKWR